MTTSDPVRRYDDPLTGNSFRGYGDPPSRPTPYPTGAQRRAVPWRVVIFLMGLSILGGAVIISLIIARTLAGGYA